VILKTQKKKQMFLFLNLTCNKNKIKNIKEKIKKFLRMKNLKERNTDKL